MAIKLEAAARLKATLPGAKIQVVSTVRREDWPRILKTFQSMWTKGPVTGGPTGLHFFRSEPNGTFREAHPEGLKLLIKKMGFKPLEFKEVKVKTTWPVYVVKGRFFPISIDGNTIHVLDDQVPDWDSIARRLDADLTGEASSDHIGLPSKFVGYTDFNNSCTEEQALKRILLLLKNIGAGQIKRLSKSHLDFEFKFGDNILGSLQALDLPNGLYDGLELELYKDKIPSSLPKNILPTISPHQKLEPKPIDEDRLLEKLIRERVNKGIAEIIQNVNRKAEQRLKQTKPKSFNIRLNTPQNKTPPVPPRTSYKPPPGHDF